MAAFVDVTIVGIAIGAVGGVMFDGLFASIVITAIAGAASAAAFNGITDLGVKMSDGTAIVGAVSAGVGGVVSRGIIESLVDRNMASVVVNRAGMMAGLITGDLSSMGVSIAISYSFTGRSGNSVSAWENLGISTLIRMGGGMLVTHLPLSISQINTLLI